MRIHDTLLTGIIFLIAGCSSLSVPTVKEASSLITMPSEVTPTLSVEPNDESSVLPVELSEEIASVLAEPIEEKPITSAVPTEEEVTSLVAEPNLATSPFLALRVELQNPENYTTFRHYELYIDGNKRPLVILPKNDVLIFTDLGPGQHRINRLISIHKEDIKTPNFPLDISFTLAQNSITIFPRILKIRIFKMSDSDKIYQEWELINLTEDDFQEVLDELIKDDNFNFQKMKLEFK